jgi:spore coat protein SA
MPPPAAREANLGLAAVYHVLPEREPFSESAGGAISRWVANVLREDDASVVLCPTADQTWGFPSHRLRTVPLLRGYSSALQRGIHFPWPIRRPLLQTSLGSRLTSLRANDVVWVHNRPDFAASISSIVRNAKAKLVLHMHNSHLVGTPKKTADAIRADHLVFVSRFLQAEAVAKLRGMNSSSVIYNGADDTLFYPSKYSELTSACKPIILFASRLVPEKGAHIFTAAMRELERKGISAQGILVGASHFGGSKPTDYVLEIQKTAPANVSFYGYCAGKKLADLFRTADIFCLPAVWEDPFPLATLEAMACKLPVVATRSGGIPEAFSEGGALLISRDSTDELVCALSRLIKDPALRRRLAEEGSRSFQRNFTWQAVRRNYQSVLDGLQ